MQHDWYVLSTRYGNEHKIADELEREGIAAYIPMIRRRLKHRRTKRWLNKSWPAFPTYLFAEYPVVMDGARTLCFEGKPVPIPHVEIDRIRLLEAEWAQAPTHSLKVGDKLKMDLQGKMISVWVKKVGQDQFEAEGMLHGIQVKTKRPIESGMF